MKILYSIANDTNFIPVNPPSIKEITLLLAKLGGFIERKGNGEHSCKVIWRGLMKLQDIFAGWKAA